MEQLLTASQSSKQSQAVCERGAGGLLMCRMGERLPEIF